MSDERLERALSDAIADMVGTSAPDYLDDILERTSRTRQRPWWTFPRRYLPMTPTFKFAAAAGLAFVLGIGLAPTLLPAVGEVTTPPAAESPSPSPTAALAAIPADSEPSFFTGSAPTGRNVEPGTIVFGPTKIVQRGAAYAIDALTSTDPRFSGSRLYRFDSEQYGASSGSLEGTIATVVDTITNDEGSWHGTLTRLDVDGRLVDSGWYVGDGAYDGLHAFALWDGFHAVSGFITPDGPLPSPEAP